MYDITGEYAGRAILCHGEDISFTASAEGEGDAKLPTFSITAYTGGAMDVGYGMPVVVDIAGMRTPNSQSIPVLAHHDMSQIVGHTTGIEKTQQRVKLSGTLSGTGASALEVRANSKNGFPYQASIGANITKMERVEPGETATANGRNFKGPILIARASDLYETSFVPRGADSSTTASVTGSIKEKTMETIVAAGATPAVPETVIAASAVLPTPPPLDAVRDLAAYRQQVAAELGRVGRINALAGAQTITVEGKSVVLAAHAILNEWTVEKTELEMLRASRSQAGTGHGGGAFSRSRPELTDAVLTAALCQAAGMSSEVQEKSFDAVTLQAAHTAYRNGFGLQQLLLGAATKNGHHYESFQSAPKREILQAAFSTTSLPGILSNVANKFLIPAFTAVESAWRSVARTSPVVDFKQRSSYRLSANLTYDEVGPTGEIKHGTLGETPFTNQAKTYGKMLAITRQMLINDDLSALSQAPALLGRGAALTINKVFWTQWLAMLSTFFTTGHKNYAAGAATVMSTAGFQTARTLFKKQTDEAGNPLALIPKILLVPDELEDTALRYMEGLELRNTNAGVEYIVNNTVKGKYTVVSSAYLNSDALPGGSANAYFLLADVADMAAMEVVFLNGQETPTVQEAQADFSTLGIEMRAFHDFGVAPQEYRAAVMMKGAA